MGHVCQLRQDDWGGGHSPNSSHPGGSASICHRPPGIQVGPNRVEIQDHFKYLGSITQGNGGQDREIQSRINTASQVFRSLKKSVFTSNHMDLNSKLHFYSCLVLSRLMYGAAECG